MTFRENLRNGDYRSYWLSVLTTRIGNSMHEIAVIWLVYETTGDPVIVSLVLFANIAPDVAISLPAGTLVDRWNRKRIMIVAEAVRGFAVLSVPILGSRPGLLIPVLLVAEFVGGLMEGFYAPAKQSILPDLVDESQLDSANALSNVAGRIAQSFYFFGGAAIAFLGPFVVFYLNAGSFLFSAVLLLGIDAKVAASTKESEDVAGNRSTSTLAARARDTLGRIREGADVIRGTQLLFVMILIDMIISVSFAPMGVIMPVFVDAVLGGGSLVLGLLFALFMLGRLLGALVVNRRDDLVSAYRGKVIVAGLTTAGVGYAAMAAVASVLPGLTVLPLVILVVVGVFSGIVQVSANTLLYLVIPDEKRGVIFSVVITAGSITAPVSIAAVGPLLSVTGAVPLIIAQGAILVAIGVWAVSTPLFQFTDTADSGSDQAAADA